MKILSMFLVFLAFSLIGCNTEMDGCMIGEFKGSDVTLQQIVTHINQECERKNCSVRATCDAAIVNRKVAGKVKIGKGALTMFLQGVKGTFGCDAKLRGNQLIFY